MVHAAQLSISSRLLSVLSILFSKGLLIVVGLSFFVRMPTCNASTEERSDLSEEKMVLRTIAGDLILGFYTDAAPQHVAQILRCAEAGVFDGIHFCYVYPDFVVQTSTASDRLQPLTPLQSSLISPLVAEFSLRRHRRGTLSMARAADDPNSAETSFSILLTDAPHLDGKYTVFGELLVGWDVLEVFQHVPQKTICAPAVRLTIQSAYVSRAPLQALLAQRTSACPVQVPPDISQSLEYPSELTGPGSRSTERQHWILLDRVLNVLLLAVVLGLLLWRLNPITFSRSTLGVVVLFVVVAVSLFLLPPSRMEKWLGLLVLVGCVSNLKQPARADRNPASGKRGGEKKEGSRSLQQNLPDNVTSQLFQSDSPHVAALEHSRNESGTRLQGLMVGLAVLAMALGSATMFAVQPMIGKLLAPWLGSVPAVWTTCLLFFQVVLLAGYAYVHWLTKARSMRRQLLLHGTLIVAAALTLPLRLPEWMMNHIPANAFHSIWIFATLILAVGGPAFVLATTAPLIQAWFGSTNHRLASNPYPLYIASNSGSLLGLLSYPFIVEPTLTLSAQRTLWSICWLVYIGLLLVVALLCWQQRRETGPSFLPPPRPQDHTACRRKESNLGEKLRWIGLSFVPSSLLLGVTSHLTMDIAAMPLLWTIPLALYLFSWTVSFTDVAPELHRAIRWTTPLAVITAVFLWSANFHDQTRLVLTLHLIAFFLICWSMHRKLYESRPERTQLTSFYMAIASGGAFGGLFNAIVAPAIFSGLAEYPLALVASLLFLPGVPIFKSKIAGLSTPFGLWQQGVILVLVVVCTAVLSKYAQHCILWKIWDLSPIATHLAWTVEQVAKWAEYSLPLIPALLLFGRPRLQAIAIVTALLVGSWLKDSSDILLRERSFFGVLTVLRSSNHGTTHNLIHGGILHGEQWRSSSDDRLEPRSYYHKEGPLGDVMDILASHKDSFHIAAVGLGTGSVAAYGQPNRPITFFEIDRIVEAIARNPNYFSYVNDCLQRGGPVDVRIGDARVTMAKTKEVFDVIVVDAFSSDSIPLHLITREAIDVWFHHLKSDGVIAFHISNRYIELAPVLGNAAVAFGVNSLIREDIEGDPVKGRGASYWVVLTASPESASWFAQREGWSACPGRPSLDVWTDEYASILPVLKF